MKILKRIFFPPAAITAALCVFCACALMIAAHLRLLTFPVLYGTLYPLSVYALAILCARIPALARAMRAGANRNPLFRRFIADPPYRIRLTLSISLGISLCYSLFKLALGVIYRSTWLGAVASYYIVLSIVRFRLLTGLRLSSPGIRFEWQRYRSCGVLLLVLTAALSAMAAHMVITGKGSSYPGYAIYAAAAYTFYILSTGIIGLVRSRRLRCPILSATRLLCLSTALVSMLSLQTAMFASFGDGSSFERVMNAISGSAVCATVLIIALFMIRRANRALRQAERIA